MLACSVYTEDLLEPGAGGNGGGAECGANSDCPGDGNDCHRPVCTEDGACAIDNAASGASCEGDKYCSNDGQCVECVVEQQCPPAQTCSAMNTCVDPGCDNQAQDGSESDIDCGGNCDPCATGLKCGQPSDCLSGVCTAGICSACTTKDDCRGDQYCDMGVCKPGLAQGDPCTGDEQCSTGECSDDVCCDEACDGACESCSIAGSQGSCTPIATGEDPDEECAGSDTCNGAGVCYCDDGMKNGDETANDCGGPCDGCGDGLACEIDEDCASKVCEGDICQVPACDDFTQNGAETDVDCGGICPDKCDDNQGCAQASDCTSGVCENDTCNPPVCGDNVTNADETCDDGNTDSYDGCSAICSDPVMHLILSEIVVTPTEGEFVEIYNPTNAAVALDQFYLADYASYYLVATGSPMVPSTDFAAQFPAGSEIAAQSFAVVSLESASAYDGVYGDVPDFDLDDADAGAPAMLGTYPSNAGLTNGDEMVVLFRWDGVSDLVEDFDYVVYGDTSDAMNKTGVMVGASSYNAETPTMMQKPPNEPDAGESLHRCDTGETTETPGGNGVDGNDETSEDLATSWKISDTPSPGTAPAAGFCN